MATNEIKYRQTSNGIELGVELRTGFVYVDPETGERSAFKGPVWLRVPVIQDELERDAKLRVAQLQADNEKEAGRVRSPIFSQAMLLLEVITEWEGLAQVTTNHLLSLRPSDWNLVTNLMHDADDLILEKEAEGNE